MNKNAIAVNNKGIQIKTPTGFKLVYVDKNGKAQVKPVGNSTHRFPALKGSEKPVVVQKRNYENDGKKISSNKEVIVKVGKPMSFNKRVFSEKAIKVARFRPGEHNHINVEKELGRRHRDHQKQHHGKPGSKGRNQIRKRLFQQGFSGAHIRHLTGRGDYKESDGGGGWWDTIQKVASPLMEVAKHIIPMLFGSGDYEMGPEVMSNSILACATEGKLGNQVPIMGEGKQCNLIRHREYLGDILSTTEEFVNVTFDLNPGLAETYPWASPISNNYEQWKPLGMIAEILTEASEYTDAVGLGFVCMATQYNTQSAAFVDKKTMLNHQMAVSSKPSVNLVHPIECSPSDNVLSEFYVRAGEIPTGADKRFYDLGRLNVAVGGQTADNVKIGELWLSYDIALLTPKEASSLGLTIMFDNYFIIGMSGAVPLGTTQTKQHNSNLGTTLSSLTRTLTFANGTRGRFLVNWWVIGDVAVAIVPPSVSATDCVFFQGFNLPAVSSSVLAPVSGVSSTRYMWSAMVDVTEDGALLTWVNTGTLPSASAGNLIITQIPMGTTFPTKGFKHIMDRSPIVKPTYPQSDIERILDKVEQAFGSTDPKTRRRHPKRAVDYLEDIDENDFTESSEEEVEFENDNDKSEYEEFIQYLKEKKAKAEEKEKQRKLELVAKSNAEYEAYKQGKLNVNSSGTPTGIGK